MLCVDDLRHAEYYGMQETFDDLYARSIANESFDDLMEIILSRENILLAYRNIKANTGSKTAGTDHLTMKDIGQLQPEEMVEKVRYIVIGSKHGYRPKPVRRKDIPKPNGSTRPLGIPCIWDRLIQQCIKQVMEPICEAKFSNNSYGFRPNRSAENAIKRCYNLMQLTNLHYVVEFDIKGFFDNVNHSKLIKQIWALGIRDKTLLWVIKKILTAPIRMPDGTVEHPTRGTPQGGIISPLLANIVLNELDHWIESQWECNPIAIKYGRNRVIGTHEVFDKSNGYRVMKQTRLKEMYIVRYADDFRIFCRTKNAAEKAKIAITLWLQERLHLDVSQEKTRVVNAKRRYSEFLGFKIKVYPRGKSYVVKSHMSDKALKRATEKLINQAKNAVNPPKGHTEEYEISMYNSMVLGLQNYYRYATHIVNDASIIGRAVMTVFTNRLRTQTGSRLRKRGRTLTDIERKLYGRSAQLRFIAGSNEPIYPIAFVQHKHPLLKKFSLCSYTQEGRLGLHDNLRVNTALMHALMRQTAYGRSTEYADNRISLFSAQWGKCAVTGKHFKTTDDIHCHHKVPRSKGGTDQYQNLILVLPTVHRLIHATDSNTLARYLNLLTLDRGQRKKLNELRNLVGNKEI